MVLRVANLPAQIDALKDAGVPCIFVKVVEAGHGGFRTPEVGRRVRQFLDKHLRDQPVGEVSDAPILRNTARAKAEAKVKAKAKR